MRIGRCRTRNRGSTLVVAPPEHAAGPRCHGGAVLLTLADLGAPKVLAQVAAMARVSWTRSQWQTEQQPAGDGRALLPFV